jgi:hypothetical protein
VLAIVGKAFGAVPPKCIGLPVDEIVQIPPFAARKLAVGSFEPPVQQLHPPLDQNMIHEYFCLTGREMSRE